MGNPLENLGLMNQLRVWVYFFKEICKKDFPNGEFRLTRLISKQDLHYATAVRITAEFTLTPSTQDSQMLDLLSDLGDLGFGRSFHAGRITIFVTAAAANPKGHLLADISINTEENLLEKTVITLASDYDNPVEGDDAEWLSKKALANVKSDLTEMIAEIGKIKQSKPGRSSNLGTLFPNRFK